MKSTEIHNLSERLFQILSHPNFLSMKGLANEVPIFIQTYEPAQEDAVRRMVESLAGRLRNTGITLKVLDLFELVLEELEEHEILDDLLRDEARFEKVEVLETLQNYSDPKTHLIPRLIRAIGTDGTQLTLVTGSGRVFPFLRTQQSWSRFNRRCCVIRWLSFFRVNIPRIRRRLTPQTFGSIPSPKINNPYYRATNLDHYRI